MTGVPIRRGRDTRDIFALRKGHGKTQREASSLGEKPQIKPPLRVS